MITKNKGLLPSAKRDCQLLAMAKGQALPKHINIKASKNSTHMSAFLFKLLLIVLVFWFRLPRYIHQHPRYGFNQM